MRSREVQLSLYYSRYMELLTECVQNERLRQRPYGESPPVPPERTSIFSFDSRCSNLTRDVQTYCFDCAFITSRFSTPQSVERQRRVLLGVSVDRRVDPKQPFRFVCQKRGRKCGSRCFQHPPKMYRRQTHAGCPCCVCAKQEPYSGIVGYRIASSEFQ